MTTPTVSRSDCSVTSRTSRPAMRTAPPRTSYMRVTSWLIVVLPAPEGPTRATSWPGSARNETPCRTVCGSEASSVATDSSDASDTSEAEG